MKASEAMKRAIILLLFSPGCSWICSTPTALDTQYRDVNRDLRNDLATVIQRAPTTVSDDELQRILLAVEAAEKYEATLWPKK